MADTAASLLSLELARQVVGSPETANASHLPHYGVFRAADGKAVTLGIVREQHFWTNLCDRMDLADLRELDSEARQARALEIRARLEATFLQRPADEWEALLGGADIPFAAVRTPAEVLSDPQLRYRGLFQEVPGPAGQAIPLPSLPFLTGQQCPLRPAPLLDEHGAELRAMVE
jgi:crotonobetainyl-CoA:carnitine CoA-transferase CaiB-like acyl-CoA transferase